MKPIYKKITITQSIEENCSSTTDEVVSNFINNELNNLAKIPNVLGIALLNVNTLFIPQVNLFGTNKSPRVQTIIHVTYFINDEPKTKSQNVHLN